MNRQTQIDAFLMDAHVLAIARLREQPQRRAEVSGLLARWRANQGVTRADPYRDEWESLLAGDLPKLEQAVCADSDHAAALRSVSPMSVLITQKERAALLRRARQQV
jgi:hypothetical protein